ncbi:chromate efflux transporter [uncultured Mucilaginibacter sp.]|uniref:chromate efflux transporter n=1 Tax=uncultured Mucilaginibacter sp. TaxID=797541 RepID=UPI0025F0D374|nr:chromate efflux transporter [uncultured Mucilaginibacter sp.]
MQLAENILNRYEKEKISLGYLFYTFLKIGCVSFGGYMALVSLVQRIMVDEDETVNNEVILDSITVASLLPGPVAVNIVAYIGYHLKGKIGAIVSTLAVLLPACTLMLILSWTYFTYAYKIEWAQIMYYVGAVVSGIILSTGFQLYKKEIGRNYKKAALCFFTVVIISITNNYLITIAFICTGAILGLFIEQDKYANALTLDRLNVKSKVRPVYALLIGLLAVNEFLFITNTFRNFNNSLLKIVVAFSGISLSLFGGGYVMIPLMQSLFVNDLHWLTSREFIDAIAFSQATPGPILVSATFIGYKLAGIFGAIVATIAMFAPSAILMIIVAKAFKKTKDHHLVKNMIVGIKVVVIGLIISSAVRILILQPLSISIILIAVAALILSFKYKISPVYLIIASISLGVITKYI